MKHQSRAIRSRTIRIMRGSSLYAACAILAAITPSAVMGDPAGGPPIQFLRGTVTAVSPTVLRVGDYYETISALDAYHPHTILAYQMNGAALPMAHGAPIDCGWSASSGTRWPNTSCGSRRSRTSTSLAAVRAAIGRIAATNGMLVSDACARSPGWPSGR